MALLTNPDGTVFHSSAFWPGGVHLHDERTATVPNQGGTYLGPRPNPNEVKTVNVHDLKDGFPRQSITLNGSQGFQKPSTVLDQRLQKLYTTVDELKLSQGVVRGAQSSSDNLAQRIADQELVIKHVENEARKCLEAVQEFNLRLFAIENMLKK